MIGITKYRVRNLDLIMHHEIQIKNNASLYR